MPAYSPVDIREIKDAAKMEEYKARVTPVVEKFGGRYLVLGGPFEVVEGSYQPLFPVLIQFPLRTRLAGGTTRRSMRSQTSTSGGDCLECGVHGWDLGVRCQEQQIPPPPLRSASEQQVKISAGKLSS